MKKKRFLNDRRHQHGKIASLLPIVAIVVLSKMHTQRVILGFIALFTRLFTMGLMILMLWGTSMTEIFTASAVSPHWSQVFGFEDANHMTGSRR
jgi:hypothetical protein